MKETYCTFLFYACNQRVRRIGEHKRKFFKGFLKTKKKKKHMNRSSFITLFKIEFLLPFTSCGKVLGKMPGVMFLKRVNRHVRMNGKYLAFTAVFSLCEI